MRSTTTENQALSEALEPRTLLAGVTLITHGYAGSTVGWVTRMADAVRDRTPGGVVSRYTLSVTDPGSGQPLVASLGPVSGPPPAASPTAEVQILLDWSTVAQYLAFNSRARSTADVAAAVLPALLDHSLVPGLGRPLAELPLHLVGHSRGASLVSDLARRLGTVGAWVEHLTLLDPNDAWDDFGAPPEDPEAAVHANVSFADDYYQRLSGGFPQGDSVAGAYNRQLTDLDGDASYSNDHSDAHLWYFGTTDLAPEAAYADGRRMTPAMREAWYTPGEHRGAAGGFFFSRIGGLAGGARPAAGLRSAGAARVPVTAEATGASRWDNVEVTTPVADVRVTAGERLPVQFTFEDANGDAEITVGFDDNANPFDGAIAANALTFRLTGQGSHSAALDTAGLAAQTPRHVFARITNGTRTRHYYAAGAVTTDEPPAVVGRHVFYNNSAFDAAGGDDASVATDKRALLPGQAATFANYTGYSRGLNGVMVDVDNLPSDVASPGPGDFAFHAGNDNAPAGWAPAPAPSAVGLRRGAGVGGSDRITFTWPDGAVRDTWLRVTVPAGGKIGLAAADVFYFGNAAGESGNSAGNAAVNFADEHGARVHPRSRSNPAPIDFRWDYNRDKLVNVADQLIARANRGSAALRLIAVPGAAAASRTRWPTPSPVLLRKSWDDELWSAILYLGLESRSGR